MSYLPGVFKIINIFYVNTESFYNDQKKQNQNYSLYRISESKPEFHGSERLKRDCSRRGNCYDLISLAYNLLIQCGFCAKNHNISFL